MNPFDFNDTNQQDVESSSNEFLDLAENNKTKDYRTLIFDHILDCQRDRYPFVLNVEFNKNDGEPIQVIRFEAIFQLQHNKNLYFTHKKTIKLSVILFSAKFLFDCDSLLLLIKILTFLLIKFFL